MDLPSQPLFFCHYTFHLGILPSWFLLMQVLKQFIPDTILLHLKTMKCESIDELMTLLGCCSWIPLRATVLVLRHSSLGVMHIKFKWLKIIIILSVYGDIALFFNMHINMQICRAKFRPITHLILTSKKENKNNIYSFDLSLWKWR